MNDATDAQNRAARPTVSTWLTANAGSGKTRVLTNRVARLLLSGVQPESILCLTYTTAAANEMQNRLFKTLGSWAMLGDKALRHELTVLGETPPDNLGRARTLFARAIEAPGGLKIQTIHSFCSKILRQFPLEAGVNPQFHELDEAAQDVVLGDTLEDIAQNHPDVLRRVHGVYSGQDITRLCKDIAKQSDLFSSPASRSDIFAAFGLEEGVTPEALLAEAVSIADIALLKSMVPILQSLGSDKDHWLAEKLILLADSPRWADLALLETCLLTGGRTKAPFSFKTTPPTKKVKDAPSFQPLMPGFSEIGERIERLRPRRIAFEAARDTVTLHSFAHVFLDSYAKQKAKLGVLDFDDLILKTKQLLTSRSLAWVLYRLDARIDHVLVDEAQDTSPAQWDIIGALTGELVATESERPRTLFVVGDKKQSIYSFQGADATGFDERGITFSRQLEHGQGLAMGELLHSFRSSRAVLDVVDAVFSQSDGTGETTRHRAFHSDMPGRVELWPLVPNPDASDELPWYDTRERAVSNSAPQELASTLAERVSELLRTGTIQKKNGQFRSVRASDIMILVQRRSALFDHIITACKAREIPIAGADRLKIGSELAVRDILAILSFLALPEDDLSLAAALKSPVFGWNENMLFDLAANRKKGSFLWQSMRVRKDEFPETFETLSALRDRVDFERPFELIQTILTKFDGREHLLARLGPEVEDGIDELLTQALSYEARNVPTLTGFLSSIQAADIEVKRETEATGNLLRVMTVHGAKGLESPIVILPDTTVGSNPSRQSIVSGPQGLPVLTRSQDKSTPEMLETSEALRQADYAERERLLYVAMTRAEKWLIVYGLEPGRNDTNRLDWHKRIEQGLRNVGAKEFGEGERSYLGYEVGDWPDMTDDTPDDASTIAQVGEVPAFPKVTLPKIPKPRSPSDLGGAKVLATEKDEPSGGLRKGRQIHLLLEHLPLARDPAQLACDLLSQGPDAASDAEIESLCNEALGIIQAHKGIFDENSFEEVEIVGASKTLGDRISGAIDRLSVTDSKVHAVDFKTNALVPAQPEDTPEGILRQMGAYLEVLETLYPNHEIDVSILWTATGDLMALPHGIVREALRRATTS
ncbi:MAG: double-strand break repair helicase AddA [Paracoccaceae bacterium]